MAFVEEVCKNKGKWYGAHTGHHYEDVCVEEINGQHWSKPYHFAPQVVNLELEEVEELGDKNLQKPNNPY